MTLLGLDAPNEPTPLASPSLLDAASDQITRPVMTAHGLVPSFYIKHGENGWHVNNVPVTQNGEPIVVKGRTLYIATVPRCFRFGIQPNGELQEQRDFEQMHGIWYEEHFTLRGQKPDDTHLRPIPSVRNFVMKQINEVTKEVEPFGPAFGEVKKEPDVLYSPSEDKFMSREEAAALEAQAEADRKVDGNVISELTNTNEKLQAQVDELAKKLKAAGEHPLADHPGIIPLDELGDTPRPQLLKLLSSRKITTPVKPMQLSRTQLLLILSTTQPDTVLAAVPEE